MGIATIQEKSCICKKKFGLFQGESIFKVGEEYRFYRSSNLFPGEIDAWVIIYHNPI